MKLSAEVSIDNITKDISRLFDYGFDGVSTTEIPDMPKVPENFRLGLIVGPSGSGKSTLLKQFGNITDHVWKPDKAIASHFNSSEEAAEKLSAVGFNSIPAWLRPYHALSTGEKFRADLARTLGEGAVIDEFTSTVDRTVAKACSVALRRYVDKKGVSGIVMASCHYDIVEWLQPDWVFDTNTGQMSGRGSLRRPSITLDILSCSAKLWPIFSKHHYLDGSHNNSARCWVAAWDSKPVGFISVLAFPNGNFKNAWREHRLVVLPDYQGLGIGVRLSDAIAKMFVDEGCRYFSKTAHPRLGEYRNASCLWRGTSKNNRSRSDYGTTKTKTKEDKHKLKHISRVCYSHEYIGLIR